ncbi:MAG: glucose 1-dehydrogenase [Deltaproteobacteria bacterium]|nr:glucose 1-dehydrogenase [Deltaproteobacteria bacterium]
MGRLSGKVSIVTGAARGTGEAIARRLVDEGASVLLIDLLDDLGKTVAADLGEAARYLHADITDEEAWTTAIDLAESSFGPLTTLVNNAAILHIAPIEFTSAEDYLRVLRVNDLGTFLGVRSAIAPLRRNGGGSIVNISSIDGHHAAPGTSAYCASKFGVRGLTKVAALELGRYGIRVNCVNPAAGSDEMLEPLLPGVDVTAMREAQEMHDPPPIGRRGRVEDVAATVAFLASDDSAFYTGADFDLDGGTSAGMKIHGEIPGTPHSV